MSSFDIKIPTSLYDTGDPLLVNSVMEGFSDYIIDLYAKKIDENLSRAGRYEKYQKEYGQSVRECLKSRGYPEDMKVSGSLIKEALVKKYRYNHIVIEFSPRPRVKGCSKSLEQFVRIMEYGSSEFPALNFMRSARSDITNNLRRYYYEYYESSNRSVNNRHRKVR